MAEHRVILPEMGESIQEATLIKWLKEEGEFVKEEDLLLEIATDKVDSEVPAPISGFLKKKLAFENQIIKIGEVIALIEVETKKEKIEANLPKFDKNKSNEKKQQSNQKVQISSNPQENLPEIRKKTFYSPLIKSIAKKEGIEGNLLSSIPASGKNGRLTKEDLLEFVENRNENLKKEDLLLLEKAIKKEGNLIQNPLHSDEIIQMDRMRKIIASNMIESKKISAHVSSFMEVDVTSVVKWREKSKAAFQKNTNQKLSFMPLFTWAVIQAIKDFPLINSQIEGDFIKIKKEIHIGIATALPNNNLIVPVIKNADHYNLKGLAKAINDLAKRARENALKPDEIQGGTYTITNIGSFGNLMGTPIILQPQVAILAIGAIEKKPAVIETPAGDLIGIRHKMYLSHTYDHRIIDGSIGCSFVKKVAEYLEDFDESTII